MKNKMIERLSNCEKLAKMFIKTDFHGLITIRLFSLYIFLFPLWLYAPAFWILAHSSRSVAVRLNTSLSAVVSGSTQK